jgi:SnoaL-like domain
MTTTKQEDLIGGLVAALIDDGFTAYCCGPKEDPDAVIAVYEWPDHLDMVTMHREGHAVAARLANPGGVRVPSEPNPLVLNPPDTVIWAWGGPMDMAIWQLLDLPSPDCPDAPVAEIQTPAALRVPREQQRPMLIRVPDPAKIGVRAARLSQPGPPRIPSPEYFNDLLEYVDRESAIGFASHFVEDGIFTWGNFPTLTGRTAITEFTQGFFSAVESVEHRLNSYHLWGEDLYATTTGTVTFTKLNGTTVTVPFATGANFDPDGSKMTNYTVYLDPSPLVGVTTPA